MTKTLACIFLFLGSSVMVCAQNDDTTINFYETGNEFLRLCEAPTSHELSLACTAYVHGVTQGANAAYQISSVPLKHPLFCFAPTVTLGQVKNVVIKFVKTNPEKANDPTELLIIRATSDAFPCSTKAAAKKHGEFTVDDLR
jgi:hypothetical protein